MPIPRYKLALVNWVSIYPLITLILWLARPLTRQVPLYVATLVISLTLTSLMTFVIMPMMLRTFDAWLVGQSDAPADCGLGRLRLNSSQSARHRGDSVAPGRTPDRLP